MTYFSDPDVPVEELDFVRSQINDNAYLLDMEKVISAYVAEGLEVISDPFDHQLVKSLVLALETNSPYSHIRIGDGEISFLAYGKEPETPNLDRFALERSVMNFEDRFQLSEPWAIKLRIQMEAAIQTADAVGVRGMWWPGGEGLPAHVAQAWLIEQLDKDLRGMSGVWRSTKHMLDLAKAGGLDGKLVCSAHSYFGIVKGIANLVNAAERTICLTNRSDAVDRLQGKFPEKPIHNIRLAAEFKPAEQWPGEPDFLYRVQSQLPHDLSGHLVLVGAGAWAEFYCSWIKERGGVGVDIGSGFDLLEGMVTRPVHRRYFELNGLTADSFLLPS
jgi:hypothetical protein